MEPESGAGNFSVSGTPLAGSLYIGDVSGGNNVGGFSFPSDFSLQDVTQAEFLASSDPLALLLGASFVTDNGCCGTFSFQDSRLNAVISGGATAASAPEPNTL